jgi:hypothetical protein
VREKRPGGKGIDDPLLRVHGRERLLHCESGLRDLSKGAKRFW